VSAENFSRGTTEKKDRKLAKNAKIALFCLFKGGQRKKYRKIVKNGQNIAHLSRYNIYCICTMLENPGGQRPLPARRCRRP